MKTRFSLRQLGFLTAFSLAATCATPALAQTPGVGIGAAIFTPDGSAVLEVRSTTQGLLAPRMTAAQRSAIQNPASGLLVYQTDGLQLGLWQNQGTSATPSWQRVGDGMGDHTAIQNVNLGTFRLIGNGGTTGIGVNTNGGLLIGQGPSNNIFIGQSTGLATTGTYNQFVGHMSGANTTTGGGNHFNGYASGRSNTTGSVNYFSGYMAGEDNTTASGNHFVGYQAGWRNTTGTGNQFSGYQSGYNNTTASYNHFDGYRSGQANATGTGNHFSGYHSGLVNTAGNYNYFSGYNSGAANSTGDHNMFVGAQSGSSNTMGNQNVYAGYGSGSFNTTGNKNVFVGYQSGSVNVTGSNNVALGHLAGPTNSNLTNATAIGYNAKVSQSNSLVLGGTNADAVNVGIGTTTPGQRLEVAGNVKISGTGSGLHFPDGTVQTTAASSSGSVTASNGLIKTGNDVALGGALTQATQIVTGSNDLQFLNHNGSTVVDQANTSSNGITTGVMWQSFKAGVSGGLTQVEVQMQGIGATDITITLYNGTGTGGTALYSFTQNAPLTNVGTMVPFVFPVPQAVVAGTTYSVRIASAASNSTYLYVNSNNPYLDGTSSFGSSYDITFRTSVRSGIAPTLALGSTGNVGVGTAAPSQKLEVAGNVQISGTGNGLRFPDGTVQTTAVSGSVTASNGLTKTGNDVALGGALTENTIVAQNNKSISFTGGNLGLAVNSSAEVTSPVTVGSALSVPFVETNTTSFELNALHSVVRRINTCNVITLPNPTTCRGRVYTIINSAAGGTFSLSLLVAGGTSVFDDTIPGNVTTLETAKRITVQSSGTRWYVISRN